ncbi:MAG TPA: RNA polymerase sigma factor [Micropepsaceae bacterium]|nr:RNA polymerase sigma factor [Micropepsaceae bacterium]
MDSSADHVRPQMLAILPRLRRFALALTGARADADDLVQDTVERALRSLHQFTPGTRMDSWMFRIAKNLWIDSLRARKARGPMVELDEAIAISVDGERTAEAKMMLTDVERGLAVLPEDQRAAIALVLIDGLSYREAASILDVPIGTLTSRLARGRETLAALVLGANAYAPGRPS